MPNLSPTEMRAWRGFLHTHAEIWKNLDDALVEDALSMAAYELLLTLQEAGGAGMRMTELARTLRFSSGGLTRLVDKLERHGFVERRRCPDDGRGFEALLTPAGKRNLRRVHAKHLRQVRARFFDRLQATDLEALARVWTKLA